MMSSALVFLMVPAIALFYSGIGDRTSRVTLLQRATDSKEGWTQFRSDVASQSLRDKLRRLDPSIYKGKGKPVELHDYKRLDEMRDMVGEELGPNGSGREHLMEIASLLVANLFFFEPTTTVEDEKGVSKPLSDVALNTAAKQ